MPHEEPDRCRPGRRPEGRPGSIEQTFRHQLVLEYLDLAEALAHRYATRGRDGEDLKQVAYLGLTRAAQRFDSRKGESFPAYAAPTIAGELKKYLRDRCWVIRPPRRIQDLRLRITRATPFLAQTLGRSPMEEDLATELDETPADIREALSASTSLRPDSLDAAAFGTDDYHLSDLLISHDGGLDGLEELIALNTAMKTLSADDRELLYRRYFLEETQAALGNRFGVTQMQISRRLARALTRLQRHLTDQDEEAGHPDDRVNHASAETGTLHPQPSEPHARTARTPAAVSTPRSQQETTKATHGT